MAEQGMDRAGSGVVVRVRDLRLLADIGINPDEVGREQPLIVSVELTLAAEEVEAIHQTVDYRRIAAQAIALADVHIPLIETFAHQLASHCLQFEGVISVRVSIEKPFALPQGLAGVEVMLKRPEHH